MPDEETAARVLAAYGCTTILRATYADATGSMLVTVGVAVLPSSAAATDAAALNSLLIGSLLSVL